MPAPEPGPSLRRSGLLWYPTHAAARCCAEQRGRRAGRPGVFHRGAGRAWRSRRVDQHGGVTVEVRDREHAGRAGSEHRLLVGKVVDARRESDRRRRLVTEARCVRSAGTGAPTQTSARRIFATHGPSCPPTRRRPEAPKRSRDIVRLAHRRPRTVAHRTSLSPSGWTPQSSAGRVPVTGELVRPAMGTSRSACRNR